MNANPQPSASVAPRAPRRRAVLPAILFTALAVTAQQPAAAPEQAAVSLESTRQLLGKWTEAQKLISQEKQEWRLSRETLQASIDVVKREVTTAEARIAGHRASIATAEAKVAALGEQKQGLEALSGLAAERIAGLEQRVLRMLPRLPPALANGTLKKLTQQLPASPDKVGELSLSTRYQNVIGVLNAVGKWNREITLDADQREADDGQLVAVQVLYVGLGQAFYVGGGGPNGSLRVAGVGTATADSWVWKPANHLADAIQLAVSIYQNEQLAKLVRLPVQLH